MRCTECGVQVEGLEHFFSGYGFATQYCVVHCPREVDGLVCEGAHLQDQFMYEDLFDAADDAEIHLEISERLREQLGPPVDEHAWNRFIDRDADDKPHPLAFESHLDTVLMVLSFVLAAVVTVYLAWQAFIR